MESFLSQLQRMEVSAFLRMSSSRFLLRSEDYLIIVARRAQSIWDGACCCRWVVG